MSREFIGKYVWCGIRWSTSSLQGKEYSARKDTRWVRISRCGTKYASEAEGLPTCNLEISLSSHLKRKLSFQCAAIPWPQHISSCWPFESYPGMVGRHQASISIDGLIEFIDPSLPKTLNGFKLPSQQCNKQQSVLWSKNSANCLDHPFGYWMENCAQSQHAVLTCLENWW